MNDTNHYSQAENHPAHSHHSHTHKHNHGSSLLWPLLLTLGFALIEAIGGWLTGSLALMGDAGHMFSDCAALGLAWFAGWISQRPPTTKLTYGLLRAEVIVALINGVTMLIVVAIIVYEAINRFYHPSPVMGMEVMWIALIGLIINILVARHLHHHSHDGNEHGNMNSRAALLHVIGDLLGSVAALIAGAVIYLTGWLAIDAILSLFISALILFSTIRLLREVLHVLMEGVPLHLEVAEVQQAMLETKKVVDVHDVHVWALSSEVIALSAHVVLHDMEDWPEVLTALHHTLQHNFKIEHATIQPELETASRQYPSSWLRHQHHS
jgi:cobalt-zinc-cadmium efflux system protein